MTAPPASNQTARTKASRNTSGSAGSSDGTIEVPPELLTVRDWLRYAVSRFNAASLVYGHGTTTAVDEAAYLVLWALHLPPDQLDPWLEARLTVAESRRIAGVIEQRIASRKPAAYLTGESYIGGHRFLVDERVIVPRSFIGELINGDAACFGREPDAVTTVLDLCTGGGSLAILAALAYPHAHVDAVDISAPALDVARSNIALYDLAERVNLHKGDLYAPLGARRYDLILSNPPYVDAAAMAALPPEYRAEPALALAGGDDGLDIVRRIVDGARRHLTDDGALVVEIGSGRLLLEADRPQLPFVWLDTEESAGEVFQLAAEHLEG